MSHGVQIKEVEEFPLRIKIFFSVIVVLFFVGSVGFWIFDRGNFFDSFLRTLETLAFTFEDETSLGERLLEIFLALVGVFLVWWVLWSVADMTLDGNLKKYLKMKFYGSRMKKLKNHIVIIGGGRFGEEVAKVLSVAKSEPFVVIDNNPVVVSSLRKKGYLVIEGEASNEGLLRDAGVERAKKVILTLPKTETNILVTLAVKEINPRVEVYSRCEEPNFVSKLKKAGARVVVVPEVIAGDAIVKSLDL